MLKEIKYLVEGHLDEDGSMTWHGSSNSKATDLPTTSYDYHFTSSFIEL